MPFIGNPTKWYVSRIQLSSSEPLTRGNGRFTALDYQGGIPYNGIDPDHNQQPQSTMKEILGVVSVVAALVGLTWAGAYHGVIFRSVFAPKYEQIRRDTYVQSESHVRGTILDLQKRQIEYLREKDPATKEALASIIRQTASQVPSDLLPPDLRSFVFSLNQ